MSGKADKLEGFILEPAAHDVREGTVRVLVEGGIVPGLCRSKGDIEEGHNECHDAVNKDKELRVLELPRLTSRVHILKK